jgi:photosystem II stability/assembly factor-like uncharacterized protein
MRFWAPLAIILPLAAQEAVPPLRNDGPMQVPFRCTQEDMDWAGLACSEEEPCPVYLELTAVEAAGNRIFAAGNLHTASTTLYSILLASEDAGKTWREAHARLRGTGLDHIQLLDFETGWISGGVVFPLAQDPFFLITTDGGRSWRRRPVWGEPRPGSIHQFRFTTRKEGAMVIDSGAGGEGGRWQRYETPDGGESWTVREASSSPLRLRGIAPPPAAWRVQAEAKTMSFRIERDSGEDRWTPVAAFLIKVGACKPQEEKHEP